MSRRRSEYRKAYFPDVLLLDFLLVDLLDGIGEVIVEVDAVGADEDDVGAHG